MTATGPSLDFQSLFEALPGAYLVLDRDYVIVAASDFYRESLGGATREQLIGRKLFELAPAQASAEVKTAFADLRASFDRVMVTGEPDALPAQPYEIRRAARDGGGMRRGYFSVLNSTLKDAEGRPCWLIHRVHDVTERQATMRRLDSVEEARRTLESRHALALRASGMGAWIYDHRTRELTWDDRAKALLGLAPERALSFAEFLDLIHPDDRALMRQHVGEILLPDGPGELTLTYRVIDAHGKVSAWLEARGRAVFLDGVCVQVSGVLSNVTERQRYEAHLRLLINELNHRVKNTLAVVQSIAMRTLRDEEPIGTARELFVARLMALAAAHDILTRENWEGADLGAIVERALAPHHAGDALRISLDGPQVRVSPRVAVSLALALHELATNAVKHGALSRPGGGVQVRWSLDGPAPDPTLRLTWTERDGPRVGAPSRKGFGLRLLERVLAEDIGGTVTVDFAAEGLSCVVAAPASAWRSPAEDQPLAPV